MCHLPGQMLLLQFCTAGEQEQASPEARRGKRAELNSAKKPRVDKSRSWKLNSELEANVVNTDN